MVSDAEMVEVSPLLSKVSGLGLQRGVAGRTTPLTLVTYSTVGLPVRCGGSPWVATITGPGHAEAACVDHDDGRHTIWYTAATSGRYRLSIRLGAGNHMHLRGSPFMVEIQPASTPPRPLQTTRALLINASARHTVRGLLNRWRAYLPLRTAQAARRKDLMAVARASSAPIKVGVRFRRWRRRCLLPTRRSTTTHRLATEQVVHGSSECSREAAVHWQRWKKQCTAPDETEGSSDEPTLIGPSTSRTSHHSTSTSRVIKPASHVIKPTSQATPSQAAQATSREPQLGGAFIQPII